MTGALAMLRHPKAGSRMQMHSRSDQLQCSGCDTEDGAAVQKVKHPGFRDPHLFATTSPWIEPANTESKRMQQKILCRDRSTSPRV